MPSLEKNTEPKITVKRSQLHDKQQARITSLEKAISTMQEQHAETIKLLHEEIARLQTQCSQLIMAKSDAPREPILEKKVVQKPTTETLKPEPMVKPSEPTVKQSVYLSVEKERRKYQTMIERMNGEIKRKDQDIQELGETLHYIESALSWAGIDPKEFKSFAQQREPLVQADMPMLQLDLLQTKALPPIGEIDPVPPTEWMEQTSTKLRAARFKPRDQEHKALIADAIHRHRQGSNSNSILTEATLQALEEQLPPVKRKLISPRNQKV